MARTLLIFAMMAAFSPALRAEDRVRERGSPSTPALTCVIYNLAEVSKDQELSKFIADTIPEVVSPATWRQAGGDCKLSYFAKGQVLVVYQTEAGHAEVAAFIKNMKIAAPRETTQPVKNQPVVPVQYAAPATLQIADPPPSPPATYPVPAPIKQPRHLFHFIIRYEGDGVIDANVAEYLKTMYRQQEVEKEAMEKIRRTTMPEVSSPSTDCSGVPVTNPPMANQPVVPAGYLIPPTLPPGHPGFDRATFPPAAPMPRATN